MSNSVTFDGAPPAGTINFGLGQPSADLLPLESLREASESFYRGAQAIELNYGVLQGDERFREALAGFLSDGYGEPADPSSLFLTGGNSQALDLVSTIFASSGDTVFVEAPSYFLAFQIFRDHNLNIVSIPTDEGGLNLTALEEALQVHEPAFIYTIPSFHNPSGQCLSAERRRRLVQLSEEHNFLIVADEVYQLLSYEGKAPPAFGTMVDSETILSLGSFSKILAPAMRLGWIQTSQVLLDRLMSGGFCNSGGSINHYTSHIVRLMLENGLQQRHLQELQTTLASRCRAMGDALDCEFSGVAAWQRPYGGYFYWLRFAADVDVASLKPTAKKQQVGFQPGVVFANDGGLNNFMRLSFAYYDEDSIFDGMQRLRSLF